MIKSNNNNNKVSFHTPQDSSEFVRMWKHFDKVLFTGHVSVTSDPRFTLDSSDAASLLLRDVVPEDDGLYTCSIMVRSGEALEITHKVQVTDAQFSVSPVRDEEE